MRTFRDAPIRSKLRFVITMTSVIAALAASLAFVGYEEVTAREEVRESPDDAARSGSPRGSGSNGMMKPGRRRSPGPTCGESSPSSWTTAPRTGASWPINSRDGGS